MIVICDLLDKSSREADSPGALTSLLPSRWANMSASRRSTKVSPVVSFMHYDLGKIA